MFTDYVYKCLDNALDCGITEAQFWDMSFAELQRAFDSKARLRLEEEKKQAIFDYNLADLIGRSVARLYGSSNKMPTIDEVYPMLFAEEKQKRQEQIENMSVIRFKQFANSYNQQFKEVGKNK